MREANANGMRPFHHIPDAISTGLITAAITSRLCRAPELRAS
ncbi:MAG TPA: hypothetical protein VIJ91_13190 [Candidatus Dormibacteraeota bacterium]